MFFYIAYVGIAERFCELVKLIPGGFDVTVINMFALQFFLKFGWALY